MNRQERRKLAKQGKPVAAEPTYMIKPSMTVQEIMRIPAIQKEMDKYIKCEMMIKSKQVSIDMDTILLAALRKRGWGKQRLYEIYQDMYDLHRAYQDHYEIDGCFVERLKLKEQGIDVEAWYNEKFNPNGTYKEVE